MATKVPKLDLNKAGEFISKNFTPLVYIGGAIAVILIAKKVLGGVFNRDQGTDTSDININTSKLTINEADATQIAKNMFDAMNRLGTDEDTLFNAVTPLNGEDLKLVVKKFGLKSYFGQGYGAILGQDKSLQGWLHAELNAKEDERMAGLFESKGVPY